MLLGHRCSPAVTEYKVLRPGEAWVAKPRPPAAHGGPVALSTDCGSLWFPSPSRGLSRGLSAFLRKATGRVRSYSTVPPQSKRPLGRGMVGAGSRISLTAPRQGPESPSAPEPASRLQPVFKCPSETAQTGIISAIRAFFPPVHTTRPPL